MQEKQVRKRQMSSEIFFFSSYDFMPLSGILDGSLREI